MPCHIPGTVHVVLESGRCPVAPITLSGRHLLIIAERGLRKVGFAFIDGSELLVVLVRTHVARGVGFVPGQIQALLVSLVSNAIQLTVEGVLTVTLTNAERGPLPRLLQRLILPTQRIGVVIDRQGLLFKAPLLIDCQYF